MTETQVIQYAKFVAVGNGTLTKAMSDRLASGDRALAIEIMNRRIADLRDKAVPGLGQNLTMEDVETMIESVRSAIALLDEVKMMDLIYTSSEGNEIRWLVEEMREGESYRIIASDGKPNPQSVSHNDGKTQHLIFFDGFVLENNEVYATALLTRTPRYKVGHTPRTER